MEELGYLDDAEFAELWLQTRIRRHPESRIALRAGLRRRGVSRDLADAAVDRLFTEEVERDCARKVLEKLRAVRDDPPSKLARKLLARGFSPPIVHEILEHML
jgi:regulatory protein